MLNKSHNQQRKRYLIFSTEIIVPRCLFYGHIEMKSGNFACRCATHIKNTTLLLHF